MEDLYGWVKNITGYFLFLAVAENLIPGKKYGKYFHLFAGMVAILVVMGPLGDSLHLEERIARFYETLVFRYQAEDFQGELGEIEEKRLRQMIAHYEEAVAQDLGQMAGEWELRVHACQVTIEGEKESEQFGRVVRIRMTVSKEKEGGRQEEEGLVRERGRPETIEMVEPVAVEEIGGRGMEEEGTDREFRRGQEAEYSIVRKLRRKIASYYDLEEAYVEIQMVEG